MNKQTFEAAIRAVPPVSWRVDQIIVFDWFDAPLAGVCRMLEPDLAFYFDAFALCDTNACRLERLYTVKAFPLENWEPLMSIFAKLEPPENPFWVPIVPPIERNPNSLTAADHAMIEDYIAQSEETSIIIQTFDMERFSGRWIRGGVKSKSE